MLIKCNSMKRVLKYDDVQTICKALAHYSNAYALAGNYSESNRLVSLGNELSDIAGQPEDWIKIEF